MIGIDLWMIPEEMVFSVNRSAHYYEFWVSLFQVFACLYVDSLIWLTKILIGKPNKMITISNTIILSVFSLFFLFDGVFQKHIFLTWQGNEYESSWIFNFIFTPYLFLTFLFIVYLAIKAQKKSNPELKKIPKYLSISNIILLFTGTFDFIELVFHPDLLPFSNYSQLGEIAIHLSCLCIFTTKMIGQYNLQRAPLFKVDEINGKIITDQPIRILGESTQKITEDIQEQVLHLKQNTTHLLISPSENMNKELGRIEQARKNLEKYSNRILEFSTCAKMEHKKLTSCRALLLHTLDQFPEELRCKIILKEFKDVEFIFNRDKLRLALTELIQNAFDADANHINIHSQILNERLILIITDDGKGVEKENLPKISMPFFTTHKSLGKFGLGVNIA